MGIQLFGKCVGQSQRPNSEGLSEGNYRHVGNISKSFYCNIKSSFDLVIAKVPNLWSSAPGRADVRLAVYVTQISMSNIAVAYPQIGHSYEGIWP